MINKNGILLSFLFLSSCLVQNKAITTSNFNYEPLTMALIFDSTSREIYLKFHNKSSTNYKVVLGTKIKKEDSYVQCYPNFLRIKELQGDTNHVGDGCPRIRWNYKKILKTRNCVKIKQIKIKPNKSRLVKLRYDCHFTTSSNSLNEVNLKFQYYFNPVDSTLKERYMKKNIFIGKLVSKELKKKN